MLEDLKALDTDLVHEVALEVTSGHQPLEFP